MIFQGSDFSINTEMFEIRYMGEIVACEPKVFDLVNYLVSNRSRLVSRDELLDNVWSGREVSDTTLSNHIKLARKILGDDGQAQRIIKTVRARGYQFSAYVEEITDEPSVKKAIVQTAPRPKAYFAWGFWKKSILILVIAVIVLQATRYTIRALAPSEQTYLIAVLPFSNTKSDLKNDYLGLAVADSIISELAYLQNINVRSASSTRPLTGSNLDLQDLGKQLNVDYILTGSYLSVDDTVRINIELINVDDNQLTWRSKQIEVASKDTFQIQDIVTQQVIDGLKLKFTAYSEYERVKDLPNNLEAYDLYLKSIAQPYSIEGHQQAISLLKESLSLDDQFAPTFVQLGNRIRRLEQFGLVTTNEAHDSVTYFQKALLLNPNLLSAMSNLAFVYTENNQLDKAMALVLRMLQINPKNAQTRFTLGYVYRYAGLSEMAINEMQIAVKLDPTNPFFRSIIGTYSGLWRLEELDVQLKRYPKSSFVSMWEGLTAIKRGDNSLALQHFNDVINTEPTSLWGRVSTIHKSYITGEYASGLIEVHKLEQTNIDDAETVFYIAAYYCMLNAPQRCLHAYKKSVENGYYSHAFVAKNPYFKLVESEPEFLETFASSQQKSQLFAERFLTRARQYD